MSRACSVRAHTRSLPERLDTPIHRLLAAEIAERKAEEAFAREFEEAFRDELARDPFFSAHMGMA